MTVAGQVSASGMFPFAALAVPWFARALAECAETARKSSIFRRYSEWKSAQTYVFGLVSPTLAI